MSILRSSLFPLFTTFLFLSCALFKSSLAKDLQTTDSFPFLVNKDSLPPNGNESSLTDEQEMNDPVLVLAPRRTYRKDPLNHFNRYTRGWNLHDRHYWASVAYTSSTSLFIVATLWFFVFGLCLALTNFFNSSCLCRRKKKSHFKIPYTLSLVLLIFWSIIAVIGCVILYTGQEKVRSGVTKSLDLIENQADSTSSMLRNMSESFSTAKQTNVLNQVSLPPTVQTDVDRVQAKLNSSALTLSTKPSENSKEIKKFTESVRWGLIFVSVSILLTILLGLGYSIFNKKYIIYILLISGWIVITGAFIVCGLFLILHDVTGDTCTAMNQWVQNPKPNTALDDILPCVDSDTSQDTLNMTKEATSQLVDVINTVITNISNINFAPNFVQFYYNQSGPIMPSLCNPFHHDLTDRECENGEVNLSNASQVLGSFVCETSPSGICINVGRLNPSLYDQLNSAVKVSYGLYQDGSFLVDLGDCEFVKRTFSDVRDLYCDGVVKASKQVYVGLVVASVAAALFLGVWVVYARERRRRFDGKSRGHVYVKEAAPRRDGRGSD